MSETEEKGSKETRQLIIIKLVFTRFILIRFNERGEGISTSVAAGRGSYFSLALDDLILHEPRQSVSRQECCSQPET
jgi:hypothetical protein